jgi:hypothetical protein
MVVWLFEGERRTLIQNSHRDDYADALGNVFLENSRLLRTPPMTTRFFL